MSISCFCSDISAFFFHLSGEEKIMELRHEKEEMEKKITDEQCTSGNIIKGKGNFSSFFHRWSSHSISTVLMVTCSYGNPSQSLPRGGSIN